MGLKSRQAPSVYQFFIRAGLSRAQARQRAVKYARFVKFKGLEPGAGVARLSSRDALRAVRISEEYTDLQTRALKLNPNYKLTRPEVADFSVMWHTLLQNPFELTKFGPSNRRGTIHDAFARYCQLRFEEGRKPPSSAKEFGEWAEEIVPEEFKKTRRKNVQEGPSLSVDLEIRADPLTFFKRVQSERGLQRIPNQQQGILLLFNDLLRHSIRSPLLSMVRKGVVRINSTLTPAELHRASEGIHGWSKMSDAQRRTIVRSRRLDAFGDELTAEVERLLEKKMEARFGDDDDEDLSSLEKLLRKGTSARFRGSEDAKGFPVGGDWWPLYRWVIASLKRPGNRRHLATQVAAHFPRN